MRALGFSSWNVLLSFLFEALLISIVGGILGCIAVIPLNGFTTSTMNFQTFSNLAFAFKITFDLLLMGILFALVMGVLGGLLPAIRASIRPVAVALRDL
jgi:putative ABC transport system permease protein